MPFLTSRNQAGALGTHLALLWSVLGSGAGTEGGPSWGSCWAHTLTHRGAVPVHTACPGARCLWGDQRVPTARQAQRPCCLALKRIQNRPLCRCSWGLQLLWGSVCTGARPHLILVSVHPLGGGEPRTTCPGASRCGRRGGSSEPQRPKGRPEADVPALTPLCAGTLDSRASLG